MAKTPLPWYHNARKYSRIQFQDIIRQRLEQITKAHDTLNEHLAFCSHVITNPEAIKEYEPLNVDSIRHHYVMEDQRASHDEITQTSHQKDEGAKIELF